MMLRRGLKAVEYLHATLLFAMFVPLVYAVTEWSDPAGTGVLYLKCLLVAVPIIVTERAAKQVKSVILYFMISALLLAGVGGITRLIVFLTGERGAYKGYEICYCAVMLAETLFMIIKRFADRVKAAKWRREEPLAAKLVSFLDKPTLSLLWYFVVFYLLGFCLNAKLLCDIAFYSVIVYTFLALLYEYFGTTKAYLEMNKRTKGIPRRRLYGVSFSMFLIFSLFLLVGMMPGVLLAGQRQYTDIREWLDDMKPIPLEFESDAGFQQPAAGGADWMELLNDGEPAPEPSKVVNAIFWAIGITCVLAFLYGIIQIIRQVLQDFRNSRDENGDRIEEIKDDQILQRKEDILDKKGRRGAESEAERIRRRYRKTIRKHRKDRPALYESPAEIEECAGLKNDEQMQQLHREYEQVRYGN
ncbi:MAG: hypothetical protein K2H91_11970 [Lachnospiraceae bacterium]|nr:hypothetical protein [Lachnospiraceae bacterium]